MNTSTTSAQPRQPKPLVQLAQQKLIAPPINPMNQPSMIRFFQLPPSNKVRQGQPVSRKLQNQQTKRRKQNKLTGKDSVAAASADPDRSSNNSAAAAAPNISKPESAQDQGPTAGDQVDVRDSETVEVAGSHGESGPASQQVKRAAPAAPGLLVTSKKIRTEIQIVDSVHCSGEKPVNDLHPSQPSCSVQQPSDFYRVCIPPSTPTDTRSLSRSYRCQSVSAIDLDISTGTKTCIKCGSQYSIACQNIKTGICPINLSAVECPKCWNSTVCYCGKPFSDRFMKMD